MLPTLQTYDSRHRVQPGERYNFLTTIAFSHEKHRHRYWRCLCDCGQETITREASIKAGVAGSCGCHAKARRETFEDLTGKVFGRLTVVGLSSEKAPVQVRSQDGKLVSLRRYWDCTCECGGTKTTSGDSLKAGSTKSCGCLPRENGRLLAERYATTHGQSKTRLYSIHQSMLSRCADPTNPYYGGRGITVAEDLKNFEDFREWFISAFDLSEPPEGMSLDRIDNNKGYSIDNLRLAKPKEQVQNRSWALTVELNGQQRYLKDVCAERGLDYETVRNRYRNLGWDIYEALELVPRKTPGRSTKPVPRSSVPGVYYEAGKWKVHISYAGNNGYLGVFETEQEAVLAREQVLTKVAAMQTMTLTEFRRFIRSAL